MIGDTSCQVVPDIPTFAVDDGFTYKVPEGIQVSVGSRVRVRVSGRKLRGFVTAVFPTPPGRKLVELDALVSTVPSFSVPDLEFLRWCATYYVAPLSTVLKRTVPPNIVRGESSGPSRSVATAGRRRTVTFVQSISPHLESVIAAVDGKADHSTMIVAPSVAEVEGLAEELAATFGDRVVSAHSAMTGKAVTAAWLKAATVSKVIIVGTREVILWPVSELGRVVVVEAGRRMMKSPSTPTFGVREVIVERTRRAEIDVVFVGPVPTLEIVNLHPDALVSDGRLWPPVEVVDRSDEPPGPAPILPRTRQAVGQALVRGGPVFVLVPRRGHARAFACTSCGDLRKCSECGSVATQKSTCDRCTTILGTCSSCGQNRWRELGVGIGSVVDDLSRTFTGSVGPREEGRPISVGTERDLIGLGNQTLTVAVDVDGMALAPNYRAAEDTFRLLVRLTGAVGKGRGRRCILQTSDPEQPVIQALQSGRYESFQEAELGLRDAADLPPIGELMAVEVAGDEDATDDLASTVHDRGSLLGPAAMNDRNRWLIQGRDLSQTKIQLRSVVGKLRNRGEKVRIDVDPRDL